MRCEGSESTQCTHVVGEGLRRIVDDDSLAEVATEHGQIFDVVALDVHAVLAEEAVSGACELQHHMPYHRT